MDWKPWNWDLTVWGDVGGVVGLASAVTVVVLKTWHWFGKKKQLAEVRRQDIESEFQRQADLLRSAGSTIGRRTDIGFFVLSLLSESNAIVQHHRSNMHHMILFSILGVASAAVVDRAGVQAALLVLAAYATLLSVRFHRFYMREYLWFLGYSGKVKGVWHDEVERRARRAYEQGVPSEQRERGIES